MFSFVEDRAEAIVSVLPRAGYKTEWRSLLGLSKTVNGANASQGLTCLHGFETASRS